MSQRFSKPIKNFWKASVTRLSKIPERHYWPIFVIISLYFIVPMSEITVTLGAVLYFKYESKVRSVIAKVTDKLPPWLTYGGSILFFLVMIDDTLFYAIIILVALWTGRQVKKQNVMDQK